MSRKLLQDLFHEEMEIVPITDDVMHATLLRRSKKTGKLKGRLKLDGIHNDLRRAVAMPGESDSRDGNVIAVEMTFELKINNASTHQFVTIPIVVGKKKIFSMSDTLELYDLEPDEALTGTTEQDIYQMLQYLYHKGRKKAELADNGKHGDGLDFSGDNQDIRKLHHSEKALALYLTSDKGCQNIVATLTAEIEKSGAAKPGDKIKVSTITLHMHSNRATCGSCELVLFGLQHLRYFHPEKRDAKFSGFLHKIEKELLRKKDKFIFHTPDKTFIYTDGDKKGKETFDRIRMFTTVTSDYLDNKTHRSEFTTRLTDWDDREPTIIQTNKDAHRDRIYICNFGQGIARTQKKEPVMRHSIFSSGANSNPHVKADKKRLTKYKIAGNESEVSFSACDSDYSENEEESSEESFTL